MFTVLQVISACFLDVLVLSSLLLASHLSLPQHFEAKVAISHYRTYVYWDPQFHVSYQSRLDHCSCFSSDFSEVLLR